jgi:hypothetical protein
MITAVIASTPDFDDYWSESGEGWSHGPQGLPQPARPNLTDCKTGPSEIQIDCLKDMVGRAHACLRSAIVAAC